MTEPLACVLSDVTCEFNAIERGEDCSIPVVAYLNACTTFAEIYTRLHCSSMNPIKHDLLKAVARIRSAYSKDPRSTLELCMESELQRGKHEKDKSVCQSLKWVGRFVDFTLVWLRAIAQSDGETKPKKLARAAYRTVMKPHLNWAQKTAWKAAVGQAPSLQHLMSRLCPSMSREQFNQCVFSLIEAVGPFSTKVAQLMRDHSIESEAGLFFIEEGATEVESGEEASDDEETQPQEGQEELEPETKEPEIEGLEVAPEAGITGQEVDA